MGIVVGEKYVSAYMKLNHGSVVGRALHSDHDRIIDGFKTEIKFSVAHKGSIKGQDCVALDHFGFNHLAAGKDWDRLILMGINPAEDQCPVKEPGRRSAQLGRPPYAEQRCYFIEKEGFAAYVSGHKQGRPPFKKQAGGEHGGNDDYMVQGAQKFYDLIDLPFVKPISEW
jgi:hypothetical protein